MARREDDKRTVGGRTGAHGPQGPSRKSGDAVTKTSGNLDGARVIKGEKRDSHEGPSAPRQGKKPVKPDCHY